jgi:hypothetical protein
MGERNEEEELVGVAVVADKRVSRPLDGARRTGLTSYMT